MKTKISFLTVILVFAFISLSANEIESKEFKVYGNCGMCKDRIENAVKSIDGVSEANWDKETKMLKVSFNSSHTDIHKIHMAITKVGHDTNMYQAKDKVYKKLPKCCKYDRQNAKSNGNGHEDHEGHEGHGHSDCNNHSKMNSNNSSGCGKR